MATQGAFSIIINNENNKILLIKRKDGPVWDLPGGRVEKSESVEMCAIREALEETGFEVKIIKNIGKCNRPSRNDTQYVFLAEITGGNAITEGDETCKLKWFALKHLPIFMVPHRKEQIKDYANGCRDISKTLKDNTLTACVKKHLVNKI